MKKRNPVFLRPRPLPVFLPAFFALAACLFPLPASAAPNPLGVVKSVKGDITITNGNPAVSGPLESSALVSQGSRFEAGADGKAVIRLLPDHAFMEIRPQSIFTLKRVKTKDGRVRRAVLEKAELIFGLKKKSEPVQCENAQTQATAAKGRFSCRSDEKGVVTLLVQDGELSVYNRPKDLTVVVRNGQKAISDLNGIKVTDAGDAELDLAGFRQNTLEVDFVNPQTEDFTTLEVEYETNF